MYSKVWTREYYLGKFVSIYFLFNYCNLKDFYLTVLLFEQNIRYIGDVICL